MIPHKHHQVCQARVEDKRYHRYLAIAVELSTGGLRAANHSWPWQAALIADARNGRQGVQYCAGSLITSNIVITAAHCLKDVSYDKSRISVVLGTNKQYPDDGDFITDVVRVITHRKFEYSPKYKHPYDIALLVLNRTVEFSNKISPICIADETTVAGQSCVVIGWGRTDNRSSSDVLMQANVSLVEHDTCNNEDHYNQAILQPVMLCAAGSGTDSCQGDSGGPLMCPDSDGVWHLHGIVSWGYGCGIANKPGVYTRVSNLRDDWLLKKLNQS